MNLRKGNAIKSVCPVAEIAAQNLMILGLLIKVGSRYYSSSPVLGFQLT